MALNLSHMNHWIPLLFFIPAFPLNASGEIDRQTWNYFQEVALSSEYQKVDPIIRKWEQPLYIRIFGNPTARDRQTLAEIIRELREITENKLRFFIVGENSFHNVAIHFVPSDEFSYYAPQPRDEGVRGYYILRWLEDFSINQATILIATDDSLTGREKRHMLREEFTQALGLINDSARYPDSIFHQDWTETIQYSPMDRRLIEILYHSEVKPGMTARELEAYFQIIDE